MRPEAAMVFAAGFGTRMAPLTDTTPKPMIHIIGRPMIDYPLAFLDAAEISNIVVNTHYLAEQVEGHLAERAGVVCLRETPDVLETGGGLKNALSLLGDGPVLTLNSDVIFAGGSPLPGLMQAWDPDRMDALLVMVPIEQTVEHFGVGDFSLAADGALIRRGQADAAPFVYGGVQILKTELVAKTQADVFSLNQIWDLMIADGRAYGSVYAGPWVDVGRPIGIAAAERVLSDV